MLIIMIQWLHPEVFRDPRYMKITKDLKVFFPPFTRQDAEDAKVSLIETMEI